MGFFSRRSRRFQKLSKLSLSEQEGERSPDVTKIYEAQPSKKARILIGKLPSFSTTPRISNKSKNSKQKKVNFFSNSNTTTTTQETIPEFGLQIGDSNTTLLISESDTVSLNSFSFAQHFKQNKDETVPDDQPKKQADTSVSKAQTPSRPKTIPPAASDGFFRGVRKTKSVDNPFANSGNIFLAQDMSTIAEAMRLDTNTQTMLAYYDAKTLEDFCMMAEVDLRDMIEKAEKMKRALAPLQIRKIEVLREWAQQLCRSDDKLGLTSWIRLMQMKKSNDGDSIVPSDWKQKFDEDLPKLKETLKIKALSMPKCSAFEYSPSFKSINMCGHVGYEI